MLIDAVMTSPVTTVRPDTPVAEAAKMMLDNHLSGLPVVSVDGDLLGIVSEGDFVRRPELHTERNRSRLLEFLTSPGKLAEEYVLTHGRTIEEVMTGDVVTITPTTTLKEAVDLMERHHVKRLPVMSRGELVGIVSRSDLLKALTRFLPTSVSNSRDLEIEDAIRNELVAQSWARGGSIHVTVSDGMVELSGTIVDERQRKAARVAAENTPGVCIVDDQLVCVDTLISGGLG